MGILDDSKNTQWETSFRLAYESEAVIPAKVRLISYKVDNHNKRRNDEAMRLQLDLLDEVGLTSALYLKRISHN